MFGLKKKDFNIWIYVIVHVDSDFAQTCLFCDSWLNQINISFGRKLPSWVDALLSLILSSAFMTVGIITV